jgi:hypothetical protein
VAFAMVFLGPLVPLYVAFNPSHVSFPPVLTYIVELSHVPAALTALTPKDNTTTHISNNKGILRIECLFLVSIGLFHLLYAHF